MHPAITVLVDALPNIDFARPYKCGGSLEEGLVGFGSVARRMYVGSLSEQVLAGACAAHGLVERGTTVARADGNRMTEGSAERFEDGLGEKPEIGEVGLGRGVVDGAVARCDGARKLFEGEMRRKLH